MGWKHPSHALAALLMLVSVEAAGESLDLMSQANTLQLAAALVPATVSELEAIGRNDDSAAWKGAAPDDAVLVWAYSESLTSMHPVWWLASMSSAGKRIGLLALDPRNGRFVWRTTRMGKAHAQLADAIFSNKPDKAAEQLKGKIPPEEKDQYDIRHLLLVTVAGSYYWMVPARGENLVSSLCFPIAGGEAVPLWQAAARGRSIYPSWQLPDSSGPAPSLKPQEQAAAAAGLTAMVGEVPFYGRFGSPDAWASAIASVRQWWSPVRLGTRDQMGSAFAGFLGYKPGEPVMLADIHKVLARQGELDRYWDSKVGNNGVDLVDFRTSWFGPGQPLVPAREEIAWTASDLASWLAREAPVVAAIDCDGLGATEPVDQVALVTGLSTAADRLYAWNPWGLPDTFSIQGFDRQFWAAWYWVSCDVPALCATPAYTRRGLTAAAPGDLAGPPLPEPTYALPQLVSDSDRLVVAGLGMALAGSSTPALGGKDAFGQSHKSSCVVSVPGADGIAQTDKGQWDEVTGTPGDRSLVVTMTTASPLPAGGIIGGGRFDTRLRELPRDGEVSVQLTCTAFDVDDRTHFGHTTAVEVSDDLQAPDGRRKMKAPLPLRGEKTVAASLLVRDDDPSPPRVTRLSPPVYTDAQSGGYRLEVALDDPSGISDTRVGWSFDGTEPKEWRSFSESKGNRYWVDVSRDDLLRHLDGNVSFFVKAVDGDRDREGDTSTGLSRLDVALRDDDPNGPTVLETVVERAENMQFRILVRIEDPSGLFVSENWPKLYYSFSDSLSPESFDGVTKMVAVPKLGPGWFTATAPWGEKGAQEAAAAEQKKTDTFLYLKVRAYDLDKDRENDDAETWSLLRSEVYLPAPLADTRTIVDIWPAGGVESSKVLWDDWFEPPPEDVPSRLFFEGRPASITPSPVPDVITGSQAKIRIHIAVSLAFANAGATLTLNGASLGKKPFNLMAEVVTKKGIWELGTLTFPTEDKAGEELKLELPSGALTTGENILVLVPAPGTGANDRLRIERILLEAKEAPAIKK
ncbi:MAG: hypothetical protein FJ109_08045 [Deltaproteobacteria bacterium]|nr:hypothetical protein [Deltaproteobacteria bacterium]